MPKSKRKTARRQKKMLPPEVVLYPDRRLIEKSEKVTIFDERLAQLVKAMFHTCRHYNAAGLAAVQIGMMYRVIVLHTENWKIPLVNPMIYEHRGRRVQQMEECISHPGMRLPIWRSECVYVIYQDIEGKQQQQPFFAFDARVIQHEVQHLDGISIVDKKQAGI